MTESMTVEEIKQRMYVLGGDMLNMDMHGWSDQDEVDLRHYNEMQQEYNQLEQMLNDWNKTMEVQV